MLIVFGEIYEILAKRFNILVSGIQSKMHESKDFFIVTGSLVEVFVIVTRFLIILPIIRCRIDNKAVLRMVPIKIILRSNVIKKYLSGNSKETYWYLFK